MWMRWKTKRRKTNDEFKYLSKFRSTPHSINYTLLVGIVLSWFVLFLSVFFIVFLFVCKFSFFLLFISIFQLSILFFFSNRTWRWVFLFSFHLIDGAPFQTIDCACGFFPSCGQKTISICKKKMTIDWKMAIKMQMQCVQQ